MSIWDKITKLELIVGGRVSEGTAAPAKPRPRRNTPDEKVRAERIAIAARDSVRATTAAMNRETKRRRRGEPAPTIAEVVCNDSKAREAHDLYLSALCGAIEYRPTVKA